MDTGILHSHSTITSLLLLAMLASVIFSFNKEKDAPKWLRISHMVLGPLMLITGIYLMVKTSAAGIQPYTWTKLALILIATPLAIVGSRKKSPAMTVPAFLLTALVMAIAFTRPAFLTNKPDDVGDTAAMIAEQEQREESGEELDAAAKAKEDLAIGKSTYYKYTCNTCHGDDGTMGFQGAKNLQVSQIADDEIKNIVKNGKGMMKPAEGISDTELKYLVSYVKSLRK